MSHNPKSLVEIQNYIKQDRLGTSGWVTYADAAGVAPVNGTGGSPTVTFTSKSGSFTGTYTNSGAAALFGLLSFEFVKDASNRQGEGFSYDFTIDAGLVGQPVNIILEYEANTAYTSNDVGMYIYDVTNSILIPLSTSDLAYGRNTFQAFFLASSSTSYRLIGHVKTTNATAWAIKFDNFEAGKRTLPVGFAGTDWVTTTAVLKYGTTAATNISSVVSKYKRNGDSIDLAVYILFNGAANANGTITIALPSDLVIDTTKLVASSNRLSELAYFYTNAKPYSAIPYVASSTTISFTRTDDAGAAFADWAGNTSAASNVPGGVAIANNDNITIIIKSIPIVGMSSGVTMLNSDRVKSVVDAQVNTPVTKTSGTTTTVEFNTINKDQKGEFATTGIFTAKTAGFYNFYWRLRISVGATPPTNMIIFLSYSGSSKRYGSYFSDTFVASKSITVESSAKIYLLPGETVQLSFTPTGQNVDIFGAATNDDSCMYIEQDTDRDALAGLPLSTSNVYGRTDGVAPAAGFIGEVIQSQQAAWQNNTNNTYLDLTSIILTPGSWTIMATVGIYANSGTTSLQIGGVSTTSGNSGTGLVGFLNQSVRSVALTGTMQDTLNIMYTVNVSVATTYYLKSYITLSGGTPQSQGIIIAVRIA